MIAHPIGRQSNPGAPPEGSSTYTRPPPHRAALWNGPPPAVWVGPRGQLVWSGQCQSEPPSATTEKQSTGPAPVQIPRRSFNRSAFAIFAISLAAAWPPSHLFGRRRKASWSSYQGEPRRRGVGQGHLGGMAQTDERGVGDHVTVGAVRRHRCFPPRLQLRIS